MQQDAAGFGRRLLVADDSDLRALQGIFSLVLALDLALRFAGSTEYTVRSWPTVAVVLAALLLVAAFVVPWRRLPAEATAVLPVLDLAALGMSRLTPDGSGTGILAVIPALWLGRQFGRRGAWLSGAATLLFVGATGVLYLGVDGGTLSRSLLIPLVATWAGLAIASALERLRTAWDEAEGRGHELTAALGTIDYQRRFSDAIRDTVDVGLVLLDEDGAYLSMNRRHRAFMRLAYPDGHAGRAGQLGLVFDENGTTPLLREQMPTYRASRGEEFDNVLAWIGHDPMTNRAVSVSARSVRDEAGRFAGAALAYHDVTEFVRALRVKDEFVASVSHELRTPLTSIVGYVDILQDRQDLTPEAIRHLGVVARNTERLQRLVADLLHTAQIDEGLMQVLRSRTDLCAIIRQAVEAASPAAVSGEIRFAVDIPDRLEAMLDEQRMAQVVDNLISNAIKYTPGGGVVGVRLGCDDAGIDLEVSDTGVGIDAADRDRLFTRFFRGRHAVEQSIQGVGLGLSITMSIVESHGGRIEVESEPGQGSIFRVHLPTP